MQSFLPEVKSPHITGKPKADLLWAQTPSGNKLINTFLSLGFVFLLVKRKKCLSSLRKDKKWDINAVIAEKVSLLEANRPISGLMTMLVAWRLEGKFMWLMTLIQGSQWAI